MNRGRHETHRVDAASLGKVAVSFIAALLFILLVMYALWHRVRAPVMRVPEQQVPAPPRLQARPRVDRLALYRAQRERLGSYGWVDEANGVAHIPIRRAMALQAARRGTPGEHGGATR